MSYNISEIVSKIRRGDRILMILSREITSREVDAITTLPILTFGILRSRRRDRERGV